MKVAIVGSRSCKNYNFFSKKLAQILINELNIARNEDISFISGGAIGVDLMAERFADQFAIQIEEIRPDYKTYHPKSAPIIRNKEIVRRADIVIAFWDGKSRGTQNTICEAIKQDKRLITVDI